MSLRTVLSTDPWQVLTIDEETGAVVAVNPPPEEWHRPTLESTPQATGLSAIAQERDEKVTRFEVIDDKGRAYVRCGVLRGEAGVSVVTSYQDDGRTLKVFVSPRTPIERSEIGEGASPEAVTPNPAGDA